MYLGPGFQTPFHHDENNDTKISHHTIINNNHDSTCNFFFKGSSIVSVFLFFKICLKDIVAGTSSNNKKLYDKCQG